MFSCGRTRFVWLFSLLVGLLDGATGIGLMFAPVLTLRLMGLDSSLYTFSLIRFIGTFVFASGGLYLWSLFLVNRSRSLEPLRFGWLATSWIRLCVGASTGIMIANGELSSEWVSVPLTDLSIALFQVNCIRVGYFKPHGK